MPKLQQLIKSANIPAVAYSFAALQKGPESKDKPNSVKNSIGCGIKDAQSTNPELNKVDEHTRFPASSLSKIVFTYLVLQLVKDGKIKLDDSLHAILPNKRFMVTGIYPEKAKQLTAQHVLSHTTGLPNVKSDVTSTLEFDPDSKLGEKYAYSNEAIYYLQQVIEKLYEPQLALMPENDSFEQNKLYVSINPPNLRYTIVDLTGVVKSGTIDLKTLNCDLKKLANVQELNHYIPKILEEVAKRGHTSNLEVLAKKFVFDPLGMKDSTFLTQPETDTNLVKVHTELGKSSNTYTGEPRINAAGSLLTTAEDFSKFIAAWLEKMEDPTFNKAFKPMELDSFKKCGLGWHLYKNKQGELIAYQYGENPNTRSFVAINVTTQKGAAFFTNSINGSSIAEQLMNSSDFAPIGKMQEVFKHLHYAQSDEPGWKETLAGKIAEDKGDFAEARRCYVKACNKAFNDESKRHRLEWFDKVHLANPEKPRSPPLEAFSGSYTNKYGSKIDITSTGSGLIYKDPWGQEIKLVRISEHEFLPEKDQSFKISLKEGRMKIDFVHGGPEMFLSKECSPEQTSVQELSANWKSKIEEHREEIKKQLQNDEPSKLVFK
ncbi:serine hydrolase domain-containing protein [Legionella sp. W05-934-2]|uniref:serine hydrolase domain-containing protein n=1 Tax=Legionella TaxID=445 RepID=UPI0034629272